MNNPKYMIVLICVPCPRVESALQVRGYAYSGGGHAIIRVDVSADNGRTWTTADLEPVYDRRYRYGDSYNGVGRMHACLPCMVKIEGKENIEKEDLMLIG